MTPVRTALSFAIPIGVVWLAFHWISNSPVEHPPGIVVEKAPVQVTTQRGAFPHGRVTLTPLADYTIQARLLSKSRYRIDPSADLAPFDFALGWRSMSDSSVIDRLGISQSNRFYWVSWDADPGVPVSTLMSESANVHMIPANETVFASLSNVREGEVLTYRGLLVSAQDGSGWSWKSSLTRNDTGAGACELFYVESIERL